MATQTYTTTPFPSEKQQPPSYTAATTPTHQIPQSIKFTYQSARTKLLCCGSSNMTLNLTSNQLSSNPTTSGTGVPLQLTLPGGYTGSLILSTSSPQTSTSPSPLARAIPGDRRTYELLLPGSPSLEAELLRRKPRKNVWFFALPGAREGETERFEWRRSRGAEVKSLGAAWRGWKLVRLGKTDHRDREGFGEDFKAGEEKSFSDDDSNVEKANEHEGEEVVAVWAKSGRWTSLHDVGELLFLGSGASGELGERWAMMALMSSMCIWQKAMRDQAAMATASAATSSTVVVTS